MRTIEPSRFPIARNLPDCDVETIPGVDAGNCNEERCERLLVIVYLQCVMKTPPEFVMGAEELDMQ